MNRKRLIQEPQTWKLSYILDLVVFIFIAWKASKYGVFYGPNTGKYGPEKNSVFGYFSRSVYFTTKTEMSQNCRITTVEYYT